MAGLFDEVPVAANCTLYYNRVYIGVLLGLHRDNGKENGNYYIIIGSILGLYRDHGKENGNYYIILGYI